MPDVVSPYNLEVIDTVEFTSEKEAFQMLAAASEAFNDRRSWLKPWQRREVLEKAATRLEERVDFFTKVAASEGGKPYGDSKVEVLRAVNSLRIAAGYIGQIHGEQIPMSLNAASEKRLAFTMREPIGVVFSISAFNHPLNLVVHQTATAIAAGCPVIIKPATGTPLSCLRYVELLYECGLPQVWCRAVICPNELAEKLACDPRVNYLSFIGSAKVGWHLRSKIAPGTRCGLEHGGAAPVIVEPDADINLLVPAIVKGGFYHAGQVCVSVQRVFVHNSISERITEEIAKAASALRVGNPIDPDTEVGPLIRPGEVERVHEWVQEAVNGGARLLTGGEKITDTCYAPTVLYDPPTDSRVSIEEIFGPVVCIYPYQELASAIDLANRGELHFQAAVFTSNINTALHCVQNLNATAVMVNDHTAFRVDWMPFGGRDTSGLGLGGIPYTINEMLREKMMVLKTGIDA